MNARQKIRRALKAELGKRAYLALWFNNAQEWERVLDDGSVNHDNDS